jgi:hypothetical protein
MKRAVPHVTLGGQSPNFAVPEGVVAATIDPQSGEWAAPECPESREEVFIAGTEPTKFCPIHGGRHIADLPPVSWLARMVGAGRPEPPKPGDPTGAAGGRPGTEAVKPASKSTGEGSKPVSAAGAKSPAAGNAGAAPKVEAEKKKNVWQKIFGIFGGGKKGKEKTKPPGG